MWIDQGITFEQLVDKLTDDSEIILLHKLYTALLAIFAHVIFVVSVFFN